MRVVAGTGPQGRVCMTAARFVREQISDFRTSVCLSQDAPCDQGLFDPSVSSLVQDEGQEVN